MRIVAGCTKAACRVVFIKSGVHSLGDKGYVLFWHKADKLSPHLFVRFWGQSGQRRSDGVRRASIRCGRLPAPWGD